MNKFYFLLIVVVIGLFLGIFYISQKESLFKAAIVQSPTDVLPSGADVLLVISPVQRQEVAGQAVVNNEQPAVPTFGVIEGVRASYSAIIKTSKGDIELTLDGSKAPGTVKNFIDKAKSGFYKNLTFHRVEDWVIQGGDPKGNGTGGGIMQTEINDRPFTAGSLGVARGGDIRVSNNSQFFINKKESPWLNGQYTNFGDVTNGMDVVENIEIGDTILGVEIE